jgi:PAS domain S-box-containing protein
MTKRSTPARLIILLIIGLFISEVISMGVIGLVDSWEYFRLTVLDATLLILLATPLLYFLSLRPLLKVIEEREAEIAQRKLVESRLRVRTTALETAANGIIITDKQGEILWANQAHARTTGYSIDEALGTTPEFLERDVPDSDTRRDLWQTILSGEVWQGEVTNHRRNGDLAIDEETITPVLNPKGEIENFIAIQQDVTERRRSENIMRARLRLMQFADTHTLDELLQNSLDAIEALTKSEIGFFHFLEADQQTISLQAWSTKTLQNMCTAEGKGAHYSVEQAGVWADCVRQRQPVVHNEYATLANRKGTPEGHAALIRELTVPILRNEKIVAILGVGNKPQPYTAVDVDMVVLLADFAWDVIENKRAESALRRSEEKFRTLAEWTYDWEEWLDPERNIVYMSPACLRITGYSPEEFTEDPDLLKRIVRKHDRQSWEKHHQLAHNETAGPLSFEYRIIARDKSEHWIEHICRPLFGLDSRYMGRRVSNRDVTERKRIEEDIREYDRREKTLTQTIHTMQMEIARDLHDTLGQNISFLRMNLEHLSETEVIREEDLQIQLQSMTKAADQSYELIRAMLTVLQAENSSDPLNLFARYAGQVADRSSFQIDITHHGNPRLLLPDQIRQLFFIYREALSNIEKYANPTRVACALEWDERALTVVISDDGRGFDLDSVPSSDHYGLRFMRDRAELLNGSLSIRSAPGQGTTITVQAPYQEEPLSIPG